MTSNHSTKETITLDIGGLGSQDKNHPKSLVCVNLTSVNFNHFFCNVDVLAPKKHVAESLFGHRTFGEERKTGGQWSFAKKVWQPM